MRSQPGFDDDAITPEPFDQEALDLILDALFAQQPLPYVMALDAVGLVVPMPAGVPIPEANHVEGVATALELCLPADLSDVAYAWGDAVRFGAAHTHVHFADQPQGVLLHFVDARSRFGVFFGIFVGHRGQVGDEGAPTTLFRPRLCRWERDGLGMMLEVDDATSTILGYSRDELVGKGTLPLIHPDDVEHGLANWMELLARPGFKQRSLFRYRHRAGNYIHFEVTTHNRLADPACGRVVSELFDVTDRMEAAEALRASEHLLRRLTHALPLGIVQIDTERRVVYSNDRISDIVGVARAATVAEQFDRVNPAERTELDDAITQLLTSGTEAELEFSFDHPAGPRRCSISMRSLTSENGTVTGAIACVADITERAAMREELEERATFDNLTRCFNRTAILGMLAALVAEPNWPYTGIAVLFIDLDGFKEVNDRYGHAAGDALLRCVGARLIDSARCNDAVGRLGGDEFLVVCPDVDSSQVALAIAHRIIDELVQPVTIGSYSIVPSASVGVAWSEQPLSSDTLVAIADAAMYDSKRRAQGPILSTVATYLSLPGSANAGPDVYSIFADTSESTI